MKDKKPFLINFKTALPAIDFDEGDEMTFNPTEQVNYFGDGVAVWNARSARRPTTCHTAGHRIKAGYTRSGKYRNSKYIGSKTDRRAGR
jgi:hypothetical protein